jgi:hypothetical protein
MEFLMVRTGTVTGREVKPNRDGDHDRLMLQVQITNADDIQTVEYVSLPGQDENPIDGTRVFIIDISASYKIAIAADDGIAPAMSEGEKRIYSLDSDGIIQAFIKLLNSGIIHINGDNDFAVRWTALNTGLQNMLTALNADIVVAGGVGNTTLDISGAKVDEVKLP